jgi:uncharacterized membrane protein YuzA (DUF378 family)
MSASTNAEITLDSWSPWFTLQKCYGKWENAAMYFRAFLAIHSSVFLWVGVSNLVTESSDFQENRSILLFGRSSFIRDFALAVSGVFILAMTDSLYGNSGLPGSFLRYNWKWNRRPVLVILRATMSLIGAIFTWTGFFNILDLHLGASNDSVARNLAYLVIGWIGIVLTNTFYPMAMVFPPDYKETEIDYSSFDFKMHAKEVVRALVCLTFQNLLWCGGFNLIESNFGRSSLSRELMYTIIGNSMLLFCKAFVPNAWIFTEHPIHDFTELKQFENEPTNSSVNEPDPEALTVESPIPESAKTFSISRPKWTFYLRASLALCAQIIHNSGFWYLIDVYISSDSLARNIIYCLFGLIMVLLTGGGGGNRSNSNIFEKAPDHIPEPLVK